MNQGHPSGYDSGAQSPRPETPEPSSIQGRRNNGAHLLDDDGGISDQFEACLKHIFGKYCVPRPNTPTPPADKRVALLIPPPNAYLSPEGLDNWARDTNGAP